MIIFRCEGCNGEKGWYEFYDLDYEPRIWQECPVCKGTGDFGFWNWFWCKMPVWFVERYSEWRWNNERRRKTSKG
jgi:hypothetical protein